MFIDLIQAVESDKSYLLQLRKLTMVEHLENQGIYLSDHQHELSLNDLYDCCHKIICSGQTIGMLKFQILDKTIRIMQFQIHPDFQNKGFGQQVIKQLLNSSGFKTVELTVLKSNPAKVFYEKLGFMISGEDEYEFHMKLKHSKFVN